MNAEVLHSTFHQQAAHGVGHAANTDLKAGSVLYFGDDAPPHIAVNLARLRIGQLRTRLIIAVNNEIDLAYMHAIVFAEGVRHLRIDLDNHQLRTFNDGPLPEIRRAKIEVSSIVHGASF